MDDQRANQDRRSPDRPGCPASSSGSAHHRSLHCWRDSGAATPSTTPLAKIIRRLFGSFARIVVADKSGNRPAGTRQGCRGKNRLQRTNRYWQADLPQDLLGCGKTEVAAHGLCRPGRWSGTAVAPVTRLCDQLRGWRTARSWPVRKCTPAIRFTCPKVNRCGSHHRVLADGDDGQSDARPTM